MLRKKNYWKVTFTKIVYYKYIPDLSQSDLFSIEKSVFKIEKKSVILGSSTVT